MTTQYDRSIPCDVRKAEPHKRLILEIARDIRAAWPNVNYAAKPYLQAMLTMTTVEVAYREESAKSVIVYFLANANSFRGPAARLLKQELKTLAGIK